MNEITKNDLSIIPSIILNDTFFSDKAKILYGYIFYKIKNNDIEYIDYYNKFFANKFNCSTVTISRLINKLVKKEYLISKMEKKGKKIIKRKIYLNKKKLQEDLYE
jgi:hypothetical protein